MTNDTLTGIGCVNLYDPFKSTLFNNEDKAYLTNQSGGNVATGDVLMLDTANDESFIGAIDTYPCRPVFVVGEDIDADGNGAVKTIVDGEAGWVFRPGSCVRPGATVFGACLAGDYLKFDSTAKRFASMDIGIADCFPPLNARAVALAATAVTDLVPVMLLEATADQSMGCRVYNDADTAITASVLKVMAFNTEEYDDGGLHEGVTNPERLTVPADQVGTAWYHIIGQVTWSAAPSGAYIAIRLNNATIIARQDIGTALLSVDVNTQYKLSAGDYVELLVYTTTAALSIKYYDNYSPIFMMLRTGDQ